MSRNVPADQPKRSLFRREPWLAMLAVALVPGIAAMVAPEGMRKILALLVLVLGGISLLLLVMHRPDHDEAERLRKLGSQGEKSSG